MKMLTENRANYSAALIKNLLSAILFACLLSSCMAGSIFHKRVTYEQPWPVRMSISPEVSPTIKYDLFVQSNFGYLARFYGTVPNRPTLDVRYRDFTRGIPQSITATWYTKEVSQDEWGNSTEKKIPHSATIYPQQLIPLKDLQLIEDTKDAQLTIKMMIADDRIHFAWGIKTPIVQYRFKDEQLGGDPMPPYIY